MSKRGSPLKEVLRRGLGKLQKKRLKDHDRRKEQWSRDKGGSVEFFEQKLLSGKMDKLLDPNREVRKDLRPYLPRDQKTIAVIDVGSGPASRVGFRWEDRILVVEAVDVNGDEYMDMFKKHGITPPAETKKGEGEELHTLYSPNTFDLAFSRNALDHCYQPLKAIQNMVDLVKPSRYVILLHRRNEGEAMGYRGAHLWNFDEEEGRAILHGPGEKYVLSEALEGVRLEHRLVTDKKYEWIYVIIQKL